MSSPLVENLRRPLLVLVALVALLTLTAQFARWHWLADLVTHFVPHYAIVVGLAAVGLWLLRYRRWALFAAALSAAQIVQLVSYLPTIPPSHADVPTIRVLQFNVGARDATYGLFPAWLEERAEEFDVVILFEVDESWRQALAGVAERFPVRATEFRNDPFGIALFSRYPDATAHIERFQPHGHPYGIVSVEENGPRPSLRIIAGHPWIPIGSRLWKARNDQFIELAETAASLEGEVALVADLNSTVWSPFYKALVKRAGLRDANAGHSYRPTWAPYALPLFIGLPIDHTLISDGLVSLERQYPPRMGSDHRPVVTTLAVRTTPP